MTQRRHPSAAFVLAVLGSAFGAGTAAAQYQVPAPVLPVVQTPAPGDPGAPGDAAAPGDTGTPGDPGAPGDAGAGTPVGQRAGAKGGRSVPGTRFGSGWEKQFVVGGAWENNVGFATPTGPDDFFGSLQASLGYWFRSSSQSLRLIFDGDGALYAQLHNRNRLDGSGELSWTNRLSPSSSLNVSAGAARAHSDTQDILVGQGIVLPPVDTTSGSARVALTTRLGARTTSSIDGSWQRLTYDLPGYLPTTDWSGGAGLSRAVSPHDSLTARASYGLSITPVSHRQVSSLMLDLVHRLTSGLALSAGAGVGHDDVTPLDQSVTQTTSWHFSGTAGATGRIRRTTLAAVYTHGLQATPNQAYDEVVDHLGISVTMPVGRSLQFLAGGAGSYRRQPQSLDQAPYRTADLFVGVSRALGRETSLALEYRYRNRDQSAISIRNDRASASLVWTPGRPTGTATLPR